MASDLLKVLQGQGAQVVDSALRAAVGRAVSTVADDDLFRAAVVDVAWNLMPTPVRLIGRRRLRFDSLLLGLRSAAFDLSGATVRLRADLAGGIWAAMMEMASPTGPAPAVAAPAPMPARPLPEADSGPASAGTGPRGEPGPAVGIDLGTTFSVVAHLDQAGRPWTIVNAEGDTITPSVVLFEDGGERIVGKEAVKAATSQPDRVARFAKREMGNAAYSRPILGESYPPEAIQALILAKLKRDAEERVGPFTKAVVTVPAYFNEPRRRATFDAGRLAGLDVLDIINEPTAAALAYGVQQGFLGPRGESRQAETVLVYDLGGGTFDVTLMAIDGRDFRALASAGDVHLGGVDWDRRIVQWIAEEFKAQHRGLDPRDHPAGMARLLTEAEDAKRALSARERVTIAFEHAGQSVRLTLGRDHFERMTLDFLERTRFTTARVVREANVDWADVTRVLLVGGSTRMPMVARMLEQESGRKPDRSLAADEAVAHGAAIYAGLLLAHEAASLREVRVRNVTSHALGVLAIEPGTGMPRTRVLIPANTPLPAAARGRFRTHRPGQASVAIRVVEGGDASGNDATRLGTCVVRDLPPGLPAGTPVEVEFRYAANSVLDVDARLPGQDRSASLSMDRAAGLDEGQLRSWEARLGAGPRPLDLDDRPPS